MTFSTNYKYHIVQPDEVREVAAKLAGVDVIGLDTETYGLNFTDPMFSLILAGEGDVFYFNFNKDPDHNGNVPHTVLNRHYTMEALRPVFASNRRTIASHNAKFDLHKLGRRMGRNVHCTLATERVLRNNYRSYSLAACAKRRGWAKDTEVEEYIKSHQLYSWEQVPGKKKRNKKPHYDKVPLIIMFSYGCLDAVLHRELALDQLRKLEEAE
jgi:ribonuclease D